MRVEPVVQWLAIVGLAALVACDEDPNIARQGQNQGPQVILPDAGELVRPDREQVDAECQIGELRSCTCMTSDGNVEGTQSCVSTNGEWSVCGCAHDWPWLGPTCAGGQVECLPLAGEVTEFSGDHCCTSDGKCGLGNEDAFGTEGDDFFGGGELVCVERYSNPEGVRTDDCGETVIPFVEVTDCCRPDGQCGLYLEYNNWEDLGCVEREELAQLLKGSDLLGLFLLFTGQGGALDEIQPMSCTYPTN
jgi:hypothetical protein